MSAHVILGNDAYAAAIGEKLYGAAKDLNDFFYLYIGEGAAASSLEASPTGALAETAVKRAT